VFAAQRACRTMPRAASRASFSAPPDHHDAGALLGPDGLQALLKIRQHRHLHAIRSASTHVKRDLVTARSEFCRHVRLGLDKNSLSIARSRSSKPRDAEEVTPLHRKSSLTIHFFKPRRITIFYKAITYEICCSFSCHKPSLANMSVAQRAIRQKSKL
jgi:hypothetical protein